MRTVLERYSRIDERMVRDRRLTTSYPMPLMTMTYMYMYLCIAERLTPSPFTQSTTIILP